MNARFSFSTLAFALLVLFVGRAGAARAQSAGDLIDRLESKYQSGKALRADFTQTVSSPFNGGTTTHTGVLTLQGDRYRVKTRRQTLVTNGQTTWVYTPAREQVLINDYVEDETAFSPGKFFDGYRERYRVTAKRVARSNDQKHYVLTLKPKANDAFFRKVTLWMRASDAVVTRLQVLDANETKLTFDLRNIAFGVPTDPNTFTFTPPSSAKVVDLRS